MVITCLIREDTSSKLNVILTITYFVLVMSIIVTSLSGVVQAKGDNVYVIVISFFDIVYFLYIADFGSFRKL
jgi:hypothetical protein